MDLTGAAALVGVCVAAIGYVVKYRIDFKLAQRDDPLARINRQLSEFYGPLLALTRSGEESWKAFRRRYRPGEGSFWRGGPPPSAEDAAAWRRWMTTVFMPVNERMTEIVLNSADLIEEPEMPPCRLAPCAHVAGYQAIVKKWESGEISVVNFPNQELSGHAAVAFGRPKAEQNALLGARAVNAPSSTRG